MTRIERMVVSLKSLRPTLVCLVLMLAGCGGAALSTSVPPSAGDSAQRPKATLAWPAAVGSVAPVWATKEGGYFEQNGVDIGLQYINGSPKAVAALIGGTAQFVDSPGPAVVSADAAGAHVVMVMAWVDRPAFLFMTTQDIARPEQLKGKTIGVTNVGGSDDFLARKTLEHFGLKPDADVHIAAVSGEGKVAALQRGLIQGFAENPPNDVLAAKAGAHVLYRTSELGIPYLGSGLATTREYARDHPNVVASVVKAVTQGIHRFKTDRVFAQQVLAQYLKNDDREVLDSAYDAYAGIFPQVPAPTLAAMQASASEAAASGELKGNIDVTTMMDASFVDKLQQSGFIRQLYGE